MGCSRQRFNKWGEPRYTAYYWDLRGRQRSAGTFARKRDADRAWRRAEARIADGRFLNLASGRQRFHRYVTEAWLPGHVMELNTRQGYHGVINKYLLPAFGAIRMNEILPAHVRVFLRRLQDHGVSAYTLARCKTVLSAIFTTALNDQVVYFHPCTGVKTPTLPKRPLRVLTPGEFARLYNALPGGQWRLLVELAVESGLRWGELAELRVGDLRRDTHVLTVARTLVELDHPNAAGQRFVVKCYPKNTEYRHLRLRAEVVVRLARYIADSALDEDDLLSSIPDGQHAPWATPRTRRCRSRPASEPGMGLAAGTTEDAAAGLAEVRTPSYEPDAAPAAKTTRAPGGCATPTGTCHATGTGTKSGTQP